MKGLSFSLPALNYWTLLTLFFSFFQPTFPIFSDSGLPRLYIQGIQFSSTSPIAGQANAGLLEGILEVGANKYTILDDAGFAALLKQTSIGLQMGNSKSKDMLNRVETVFKPEFLIMGEATTNQDFYEIRVSLLALNSQNKFETRSSKTIRARDFQVYYYLREIGKSLLLSSYVIDEKKIPALPALKPLDMKPVVFPTTSFALGSLSDAGRRSNWLLVVETYLPEADRKYQEKSYDVASNLYKTILEKMDSISETAKTKVPPPPKLVEDIKLRRKAALSQVWKTKIDSLNAKIDKNSNLTLEKAEDMRDSYVELLKEWNETPSEDRIPEPKEAILSSIKQLELAILSFRDFQIIALATKKDFYEAFEEIKEIIHYMDSHEFALSFGKEWSEARLALVQRKLAIFKTGQDYESNLLDALLDIAELEDLQAQLEEDLGRVLSSRKHRDTSVDALDEAFDIITKSPFQKPEWSKRYKEVQSSLDKDKNLDFSLRNFSLLIPRYIGNIGLGIADLFVVKTGDGLEVGAEAFVFGTSIGKTEYNQEFSRGWRKTSEVSSLVSNSFQGFGQSFGFGIVSMGECGSFFSLRLGCYTRIHEAPYNREFFDPRKFTNLSVTLGLGKTVRVSVESHRSLELVGILGFQNWDLYQSGVIRYEYFSKRKGKPL